MSTKGVRYMVKGVRWLFKAFIFLCLLLCHFISYSQKIIATFDRDKIIIGEQVTLQLKVIDVNPRLSSLQEWFSFPDSLNHLSIIKKDSLDTLDVGGLTTYLQHLTITSFDSGKWAVPLQPIILTDKATGKQTTLKPDSVFLQVLPVDVSNLKDYHDIKDIIDVPRQTDYTLLIAAAVSVVVVVILVILILKRKKRPAPVVKKVPKSTLPPLEEAIYQLKELEKQGLPAKGQVKQFYTRLDEICREYIEARMNVDVSQFTSDELLPILAVYLQAKKAREDYRQVLQLTDAVKFAKYIPGPQENTEALQLAAATLQHIEEQVQITKQHVN